MEDRVTYAEIKDMFLDVYYRTCRNHYNDDNWPTDSILSFVYHEFSDSYELDIENLMLNVIGLVLVNGRYKNIVDYMQNEVKEVLSKHSLAQLLIDIPNDEANEFLYDLEMVKTDLSR